MAAGSILAGYAKLVLAIPGVVLSWLIFHTLRFLVPYVRLAVDFAFALAFAGRGRRVPPISSPLLLLPAEVLGQRIRSGQVSSEAVVKAYIDRIKEVQPLINAMADNRFQDALAEARAVDEQVANGEAPGDKPFLGVPFTVKISVAVKGLPQSTGLVCRKSKIASEDGDVVRLMKQAGAILLCTSNTPELCMWWDSQNHLYGRTNNPYDTSRIPGGSSGGEGALIASGGSLLGIGSDIGGSIRIPSMYCGIFGHKPSSGVTPITGKAPPAEGDLGKYLVTGPMCRYARDLLPMLRVLAADHLNKLQLDVPVDLRHIRLFYADSNGGSFWMTPISRDQKQALFKVVRHLEQTYGLKASRLEIPELAYSFHMWVSVLKAAEKIPFEVEMADRKGRVDTLKELFLLFLGRSEHTLAAINMGLIDRLLDFRGVKGRPYITMTEVLGKNLKETLGDTGILLLPTLPEPAPHHFATIPKSCDIGQTGIFNLLGFPATSCPVELNKQGLPLGVEVVSNLYNDRTTLAVAREISQAFGGWVQARINF